MYCSNCGNKNDGSTFCTQCGNRIDCVNNEIKLEKNENSGLRTASIVLGTIGLVFCFTAVLSPISLILTIIGLILGIVATKKVRNILGIVLNSVGLFLSLIILFVMGLFIRLIIALPDEYGDDYYYEENYDWDYDNHREYY